MDSVNECRNGRKSLGYRNVDLYVNINILDFGKYYTCSALLVK